MDTLKQRSELQQNAIAVFHAAQGSGIITAILHDYNDKCHAGERGSGNKYTVTSTEDIANCP
jgi:hypothetical protein